jgi:hypothetical protein
MTAAKEEEAKWLSVPELALSLPLVTTTPSGGGDDDERDGRGGSFRKVNARILQPVEKTRARAATVAAAAAAARWRR